MQKVLRSRNVRLFSKEIEVLGYKVNRIRMNNDENEKQEKPKAKQRGYN